MRNKVLITGSQGFVGRYLVAALLREFSDITILGIGRSSLSSTFFTHDVQIKDGQTLKAPLPTDLRTLNGNYTYLPVDLLDLNKLHEIFNDFSPTAIIHLASGLKGDSSSKLFHTNVLGTFNLLSVLKSSVKDIPIISVSSGSVYGFKSADPPFEETQQYNPEDQYQFAKATEEVFVREFCDRFNIPWMILRVFNIVGPGQDERHVCGRFISELVSIKGGYKKAILNVSSLTSQRDFVDVRDVANNIVKLFQNGKYNEVYNICSSKPLPIRDILEISLNLVFEGKSGDLTINGLYEKSSNDINDRNFGNNKKLLEAGGKIDFEINISIKDIVDYYEFVYEQYI